MATFIVLKNSFKNLNTVIPILFIVLNDMKKLIKCIINCIY